MQQSSALAEVASAKQPAVSRGGKPTGTLEGGGEGLEVEDRHGVVAVAPLGCLMVVAPRQVAPHRRAVHHRLKRFAVAAGRASGMGVSPAASPTLDSSRAANQLVHPFF